MAQLHGRGRLLHMRAAQHPLRADRQRAGNECQQLSAGMNMSAPNGAAVWSSLQAFDTFSEDPRCACDQPSDHAVLFTV